MPARATGSLPPLYARELSLELVRRLVDHAILVRV